MSNKISNFFVHISFVTVLFISFLTNAIEYELPEKGFRLIGVEQSHKISKGDYFQKIAEQYDVGFLALMAANPDVDPFLPELDSDIVIPSAMLLPYIKREGIVINLPELRLYYFLPEENKVHVFPVGIGREGLATPKVTSYISSKRKDPTWRPTAAMRQRYFEKHGKEMVKEIAAGSNNPFGKYALRLGTSEYLIHGTNQRFGIGMRASSGCIRLFDDDIKWLFENIPLNTKVRIIEQPIKMSYGSGGRRFIEIHSPLTVDNVAQKNIITSAVKSFIGKSDSVWQKLNPIFDNPQGLIIELAQ
ncbi:MAG: L,D-transpeptidase family protein [Colwellia sp.]|nr:L,D-transpeptidase family protein [Colwellia sp.]